jgi:type IV secretory pathway VirB4 component
MKPPQIALVGTTRAGKSVLMTVSAKRLENKRNGIWLKPLGRTYAQMVMCKRKRRADV